jgi:hypothetical protein
MIEFHAPAFSGKDGQSFHSSGFHSLPASDITPVVFAHDPSFASRLFSQEVPVREAARIF